MSRSPRPNQAGSTPYAASSSLTTQVSSSRPQPRSAEMPPPRVYITVSRSGQTRRPNRVMSSAVFPITVISASGTGRQQAAEEGGATDATGKHCQSHGKSLHESSKQRTTARLCCPGSQESVERPPTSRGALVVTDATKKLREPVAYILLAFAGLVALASLIRLFVGSSVHLRGRRRARHAHPAGTHRAGAARRAGRLGLRWWRSSVSGRPTRGPSRWPRWSLTGVIALLGADHGHSPGFAETGDGRTQDRRLPLRARRSRAVRRRSALYVLHDLPGAARAGPRAEAGPARPVRRQRPGRPAVRRAVGPAGQGQYGASRASTGQYGQYGQHGRTVQGQYGQPDRPGPVRRVRRRCGCRRRCGRGRGYAAGQQGESSQWPQEQGWNQGEQQSWSDRWRPTPQQPPRRSPPRSRLVRRRPAAEPTQQWSAEGPAAVGRPGAGPAVAAGAAAVGRRDAATAVGRPGAVRPAGCPAGVAGRGRSPAQQGEQGWTQQGWQQARPGLARALRGAAADRRAAAGSLRDPLLRPGPRPSPRQTTKPAWNRVFEDTEGRRAPAAAGPGGPAGLVVPAFLTRAKLACEADPGSGGH